MHSAIAKNDFLKAADDELTRLAEKFLEACASRDVDYVSAHAADNPTGSFSGITSGSDPDWTLKNTVNHLKGLKPAQWSGLALKGLVAGDFAWFTDLSSGLIPTGEKLSIRTTIIMRRSDGVWKAIHFHVSEPVDRAGVALD